jgi:hypothetical protein
LVSIPALWLPILLSAVAVWLVSFLVWAVLPWHRNDYGPVPDEEALRAALKDAPAGAYNVPHLPSRKALEEPEHRKKFEEGPAGFLILAPKGVPAMGKPLVLWLVWNLVVAVVVAYLAGRTLVPGTDYLQVFRVTSTLTWMAYSFAAVQESIWFWRPWSLTCKQFVDALLFGLITGGFFGWLWPA